MTINFNFFPAGAPFPSTCAICGDNRNLFDLQFETLRVGVALICVSCVQGLAAQIGFVDPSLINEKIEKLTAENENLTKQLEVIPNHIEELINGIRSNVSDFVFAVSDSSSVHHKVSGGANDGADTGADEAAPVAKRAGRPPRQPVSE